MKKILLITLCIAIASGCTPYAVMAENVSDTHVNISPAEEATVYNLTLEQALKMAFTENEQIIANGYKQTADEISIKNAHLTRSPYKNIPVNITNNFELYCLKQGYYIDAAQMASRLTVAEAEKIKSSISYNVTQAYYNLAITDKLIVASSKAYDMAVSNKKMVDAQYDIGLIPKLDYQNAALAVEGAENAVNSNKLNRDIAEENLKILLNLDGKKCTLIPVDEVEYGEFNADLDSDIAKAMETRYDLTCAKENMLLSQRYFELAKVLTENSATYNTAYSSYLDSQYTYNNARKMISLSLKSCYNTILTSKKNVDMAEKQYDIQKSNYEACKIKYELGVITNMELTKAMNSLYDAEVSLTNAKLAYRMALEKYKYEISTGL